MKAVTGKAPISVDWVDANKGDESRLELRSRLVVQETKRVTTLGPQGAASAFAALSLEAAVRVVKGHD